MNTHQDPRTPDLFPTELKEAEQQKANAIFCASTVRIIGDQNPENPREFMAEQATMVCRHPRYHLGDEESPGLINSMHGILEDLDEDLDEDIDEAEVYAIFYATDKLIALPLYLYDHSGITMNTTGFSCGWDSGQVGFIWVSQKQAQDQWPTTDGETEYDWQERVKRYLEGDVSVYDQYLRGDVYGFVVEDEDGEELDSCWGFYGSDIATNGILAHLPKCLHEKAEAAEIEYGY